MTKSTKNSGHYPTLSIHRVIAGDQLRRDREEHSYVIPREDTVANVHTLLDANLPDNTNLR